MYKQVIADNASLKLFSLLKGTLCPITLKATSSNNQKLTL